MAWGMGVGDQPVCHVRRGPRDDEEIQVGGWLLAIAGGVVILSCIMLNPSEAGQGRRRR